MQSLYFDSLTAEQLNEAPLIFCHEGQIQPQRSRHMHSYLLRHYARLRDLVFSLIYSPNLIPANHHNHLER